MFLDRVRKYNITMNGSYNAGMMLTNTNGWYGYFQVWLNTQGVAKLLSVPVLKCNRSMMVTYTKVDWIITTPGSKILVFKSDAGVCKGMPYIDLREHTEGFSIIESICKKFAGATREETGELGTHLMKDQGNCEFC